MMFADPPTIAVVTRLDHLGLVLEAARERARELLERAHDGSELLEGTPTATDGTILGYRNREEAVRQAEEIMTAARAIASAAGGVR